MEPYTVWGKEKMKIPLSYKQFIVLQREAQHMKIKGIFMKKS
jgi:hypothetical protein